jgi:DNA-binding HxlR family transcriptional regulator
MTDSRGVKHYGQYCPVARTSEILAERWTPILMRNLLGGCTTFGELLDGAPGISRALLAERLSTLEHAGIIESVRNGRSRTYLVTQKGRELKAVIDAMGAWGARWTEVEPHHVDPDYVLWATSRLIDPERIPRTGFVVRIELADRPKEVSWLLVRRPVAEVCTAYPGQPEDLVLRTDSETLARVNLRHVTFDEAERSHRIAIDGPRGRRADFVRCLRPSPYAAIKPAAVGAP